MIQPSRQLGQLKHPSDHRGFLGNHYEQSTPIMDSNNNNLQSADSLLTKELSRTLQMDHGKANGSVPSGFEQRTPLQLNMKQRSSTNPKLSRPSLSAALPVNPSYNTTNPGFNPSNPSYNSSVYKGSTLRHKTAPVGKIGSGPTTVNRGHAADLISQQYNHFLSQTHKVPPSAAAR